MTLEDLRHELEELDLTILEAIAERQQIVRRIEEVKAETGRPIRDFQRERDVFHRAEAEAERLGLDPQLARSILESLVQSSLEAQERQRVSSSAEGDGRRALVIGGAGRMGRWMTGFLASQGYGTEIADPAAVGGPHTYTDWTDAPGAFDLIVVATPLRAAREILNSLAESKPAGVVLDLGSLKTPLRDSLRDLVESGVDVASIHPLFGPDVSLLSGRHVLLVDLGRPRAVQLARDLFSSTLAEVLEIELEEHDRLMSWILGLSHALNIVFLDALATAGESASRLASLASTTFDHQFSIARRVVQENPRLYFEIQNLNPHTGTVRRALSSAVETFFRAVENGNETEFVETMERARGYVAESKFPL